MKESLGRKDSNKIVLFQIFVKRKRTLMIRGWSVIDIECSRGAHRKRLTLDKRRNIFF